MKESILLILAIIACCVVTDADAASYAYTEAYVVESENLTIKNNKVLCEMKDSNNKKLKKVLGVVVEHWDDITVIEIFTQENIHAKTNVLDCR